MANDRDCENCIHKINGACKVWECKFEPKRGMTKEEAIEIIECGEISNRWGKDGEEVERMAIEALKQEPCDDCISRQAVLDIVTEQEKIASDHVRDTPSSLDNGLNTWVNPAYTRYSAQLSERSQFKTMIQTMPPVNPQKPKSECEHDHEILKAYSDGASAVLESLIEQYEHYLELLDADMKDGSATIVTKTKYAVYTEVVKQLKEVLESEDKA